MRNRHYWVRDFVLDERSLVGSAAFARSALGQAVINGLLAHDTVVALVAAIEAAPSRPPHPALARYLVTDPVIGEAILTDDVSILVGRVVKQIVCHIGGKLGKTGIPITVAHSQTKGATFLLPSVQKGALQSAAERTAWIQRLIKLLAV